MATTIANLTVKQDGTLEGMLTTLNVNVPIALVPNAMRNNEDSPVIRVIARRNGFEIGAGWNRTSKQTGEEYLSIKLAAPEFGVIFGNLAPAPGNDPDKKVILWNPPG
ncbi:MAG: DUF736 domain-containing protein [Bosea sp.]|jgi:uncharacterized protein (DUF736 family)|uniref:DUF736 domain-containing protein n=1 Tax=Hyphomicrobiales TaxID=356 RepID=UPI0008313C9D|nr:MULTISPECIES: DUF736 family protein [Hyphomicrobiales]MCP4561764.1 DUF736 domain-containing protein [Bosea sp. (in: a-proteobacteria)]MCP4736955.1 DUF736 domain-containing protein [Bosea sp. (in: a-proteobacteria)]MDX3810076.1 DUF736 family protein [Bosea sp. (in: a-proteobacteria)]